MKRNHWRKFSTNINSIVLIKNQLDLFENTLPIKLEYCKFLFEPAKLVARKFLPEWINMMAAYSQVAPLKCSKKSKWAFKKTFSLFVVLSKIELHRFQLFSFLHLKVWNWNKMSIPKKWESFYIRYLGDAKK